MRYNLLARLSGGEVESKREQELRLQFCRQHEREQSGGGWVIGGRGMCAGATRTYLEDLRWSQRIDR